MVYRTTGGVDAIAEHSRRLVSALGTMGVRASYCEDGLAHVRRTAGAADWILLQYNPFSYGHWGVAPSLITDAVALRRRTGAPLALLVHEPWIEPEGWRSTLMCIYQRAQLWALRRTADRLMATTEWTARVLGHGAVHVPVSSNITPTGSARAAARERLGLGSELVVSLFGANHPSRALGYAEAAIGALAAARGAGTIRVLNLGARAPALSSIPPAVAVDSPGALAAEEISLRLAATDLMLLPFSDGMSTRRTTLMAALAHGVPVLGVHSERTDRVLLEHPEAIALTPVGDPQAFARRAVELAAGPDRLSAAGEAGRRLYLQRFDWPVVARQVLAALGP